MARSGGFLVTVLLMVASGTAGYMVNGYLIEARTPAVGVGPTTSPAPPPASGGGADGEPMIVPRTRGHLWGPALLETLERGGNVIFLRHFQTDASKPKDPIVTRQHEMSADDFLATCEEQRPLSDYGRVRARLTGEAIRHYEIPIGTVYSSPYCRVREGLELLLGRAPDEVPTGLMSRGGEWSDEEMKAFLLPLLGEPPPPGKNTLISAHRTQMEEVGSIAEGEMYVFRPTGDGGFDLIATIRDSEWIESTLDPRLLGLGAAEAAEHGIDLDL